MDALRLPPEVEIDARAAQGEQLSIGVGTLMAEPEGLSLIIDDKGQVSGANELAHLLLESAESAAMLHQLATAASTQDSVQRGMIGIAGPPARSFAIMAVPAMLPPGAESRAGAWLSGTEISIKDQLIDALAKSRGMFKDLAEIGSDFCWQIGDDGLFRYVSPRGALGFESWELNGQAPDCLGAQAPALFAAREPVHARDLWLTDKSGQPRCLSIDATPLFQGNSWAGTRGVAQDVTALRQAEQQLQAARQTEAVMQSILEAINSSIEPDQMLTSAARAARRGLSAVACRIDRDAGSILEGFAGAPDLKAIEAPCLVGGTQIGSITVARHQMWTPDDETMLARIAGHIAMAIAQANHLETLENLSLTDGLTQLRNRRAFEQDISGRLARFKRNGGSGCLVLIDVDHFKTLNDTYGHQAGDEALRGLAAALRACIRSADLAGRLGGDEFIAWLEDCDVLGAERVCTVLRARMRRIAEQWPDVPLSLSIGIAATTATSSNLNELYERADAALYRVKHNGRDGTAIWGQDDE